MSIEEFGQTLRTEREKRNLNIEDVAEQLKINVRQLRALENGDIDSLPHPAYARGFLRSYAKLLGLDPEQGQQLSGSVDSEVKGMQENSGNQAPLAPPTLQKTGRSGMSRLAYILLTLFVICGICYYVWDTGLVNEILEQYLPKKEQGAKLQSADTFMAQKDARRALEDTQPQISPEEPAENRPVYPPRETVQAPIQKPVEPLQATIPIKAEDLSGSAHAGTIPAEPVEEKAALVENPPEENNTEENRTASGHKLVITAVEECWIYSNADKSDTRQFSLRKGDTFALPFMETLVLKLGNAGGVRLRYDGNDLPPPGTSGQVKTITFPPEDS